MVSFQLENQEQYNQISERLRNYPKWARVMNNVWIVRSKDDIPTIRGNISSVIGEGDGSVLVMKVSCDAWGTYNVEKNITDWMRENV